MFIDIENQYHQLVTLVYFISAVTVWLILGEVFGCVLSLFMGATDQPLPTDEEVIVCDENTTAEEVG
jgi:hypothetical protein